MTESTSEGFGNIPNASANFGTFPQSAEDFQTMRNNAERTEQHTLTVREVARLFEQAGVPRTERSIINWCQPNRQGIARWDAFFDTNERKYFITPQSVTLAIREEQSKQPANAANTATAKELPKDSDRYTEEARDTEEMPSLRLQVRDLEITNRAKDHFIKQLQEERNSFNDERQRYVQQLIASSRQIGELQSTVLQMGSGATDGEVGRLPKGSEIPRNEKDASRAIDAENQFRHGSIRENGVTDSQQGISDETDARFHAHSLGGSRETQ